MTTDTMRGQMRPAADRWIDADGFRAGLRSQSERAPAWERSFPAVIGALGPSCHGCSGTRDNARIESALADRPLRSLVTCGLDDGLIPARNGERYVRIGMG